MAQTNPAWGHMTLINAAECDREAITNPALFQEFIDELLDKIEMVKIGDLQVIWCETNDPLKKGHSIYQLLQDSNVSAHFCPENGDLAFMDIFSCKNFTPEDVVEIFKKYFKPKKLTYSVVERNAP